MLKPVVVEHVDKYFGGLGILKDVSLTMEPGERRALLGANGAGKTALFQVMSGLIPPSKGRFVFFGTDVTSMSIHQRAALGIGRTFQITSLFPFLTVEENLLLSLRVVDPGASRFSFKTIKSYKHLNAHAESLLEQTGLRDWRHEAVRNLSYGDQRKLEILLALAQKPKLLMLDEPTCGLTQDERATITGMVKALGRDVMLLVIEHDLDVAFELAEQVTILSAGKVLIEGPADEVRGNPDVQRVYLGLQRNEPA